MTGVIVSCLTWLHGVINSLLPSMNGGFSANVVTGVTFMANLINTADYLVPVSDIFAITAIVVGIRLTMFGVFAVNWLVRFFVV